MAFIRTHGFHNNVRVCDLCPKLATAGVNDNVDLQVCYAVISLLTLQ